MHITVYSFLVFLASLLILSGVWQFLWIVIHKKGYELEKLDGESFSDFLFRYYEDDWRWRLRRRLLPKWYVRSKLLLLFIKVKGVIFILGGLSIVYVLYFLSKSEYAPWLYIEI